MIGTTRNTRLCASTSVRTRRRWSYYYLYLIRCEALFGTPEIFPVLTMAVYFMVTNSRSNFDFWNFLIGRHACINLTRSTHFDHLKCVGILFFYYYRCTVFINCVSSTKTKKNSHFFFFFRNIILILKQFKDVFFLTSQRHAFNSKFKLIVFEWFYLMRGADTCR